MTNEQRKDHIAALLRERSYAIARGDADTARQIDDQLELYGHKAKPPAKRATKMTRKPGTEL